jgi:hypothetical protein
MNVYDEKKPDRKSVFNENLFPNTKYKYTYDSRGK